MRRPRRREPRGLPRRRRRIHGRIHRVRSLLDALARGRGGGEPWGYPRRRHRRDERDGRRRGSRLGLGLRRRRRVHVHGDRLRRRLLTRGLPHGSHRGTLGRRGFLRGGRRRRRGSPRVHRESFPSRVIPILGGCPIHRLNARCLGLRRGGVRGRGCLPRGGVFHTRVVILRDHVVIHVEALGRERRAPRAAHG